MGVADEMLKDPFSETSRRHRKTLVGVSALSILMCSTGWLPTEFSSAGLIFVATDREVFLWLMTAAVLYFLVSFVSYVLPEQMYANANIARAWTKRDPDAAMPWQVAISAFGIRYIMDLALPLVIAAIALISLLWTIYLPPTPRVAWAVTWVARIAAVISLLIATGMMIVIAAEVMPLFRWNIRRVRGVAPDEHS